MIRDSQPAGSEANLTDSLMEIGQSPDRIIALANAAEAGYRAATDESRSLGIFGSPTFMAGNELFWGDDRLEDAISWHQTGVVA